VLNQSNSYLDGIVMTDAYYILLLFKKVLQSRLLALFYQWIFSIPAILLQLLSSYDHLVSIQHFFNLTIARYQFLCDWCMPRLWKYVLATVHRILWIGWWRLQLKKHS